MKGGRGGGLGRPRAPQKPNESDGLTAAGGGRGVSPIYDIIIRPKSQVKDGRFCLHTELNAIALLL